MLIERDRFNAFGSASVFSFGFTGATISWLAIRVNTCRREAVPGQPRFGQSFGQDRDRQFQIRQCTSCSRTALCPRFACDRLCPPTPCLSHIPSDRQLRQPREANGSLTFLLRRDDRPPRIVQARDGQIIQHGVRPMMEIFWWMEIRGGSNSQRRTRKRA